MTKQRYGSEHYAKIGRKGGATTAKRGADYYAEIGRKGGQNSKGSERPRRRRP